MIKKLLLVFPALIAYLPVSADTYMRVVDKEAKTIFRANIDDVAEVYYEEDSVVSEHAYVDLGLPSGLKWASCNLGAANPEDCGDYFAWAGTSVKDSYSSGSSPASGIRSSDLISKGVTDKKGNLTAKYDAATKQWGENWRMPTKAEYQELLDKCEWNKKTINGIEGYLVSSGVNSNSIFIPAAGERNGTTNYEVGSCGYYWSSTVVDGNRFNAYRFYFYSRERYMDSLGSRDYGRTIRPVYTGEEEGSKMFMKVLDKDGNIIFSVCIDDVAYVDHEDDAPTD